MAGSFLALSVTVGALYYSDEKALLSPWEDSIGKETAQELVGPVEGETANSTLQNPGVGPKGELVPTFEMFWEPVPNSLYLTVLWCACVFSLVSSDPHSYYTTDRL